MALETNDLPNRVIVDKRDQNKIIVQEQITKIEISQGGPQGIPGPAGATGATGPAGATGPQGPQGEKGTYTVSATAPANPNVGDTWFNSTTSQMYIRYDGFWVETSSSYLGPANTLNIGTVTTGAPGSNALVTITGNAPSQTLSFTIPRGDTGTPGNTGETGAAGPGVAIGGTAGQVLTKVDSTAYNTQWVDASTVGAPSAIRWSPTFAATGLTFTGSNSTYPTYNSYYVKFGQLVSFNIKIDLTTVTNFGTGQLKVDLPFAPISSAANHFSAWCWVDPSQPADDLNGHIQMVADHISGSQTLDLHWLLATTSNPKPIIESLFSQGTPVTLTTSSKIYVNGTYISAS